ncbi:pilus assembly protein CpaB [Phycicoccus badiiscoriae]|uniref:Pilus assembly protein CpaB n=1 Tax=Pedococcus badiiscoriae TaxID=642776 RepID=A0A852WR66_9MICO|nr:RcpC/CpaB family pilus assembly protein [Pedococcus badiiscoriae]NYG07702.1 pilus assembly protein CpaB [Pedococcus badiiscoriae]
MGRRLVAIFAAALVALLGVSAVLLYAKGADNRAIAAQSPTSVYVVQTVVPAGTTLKDAVQNGLIVKTSVPAKAKPAGALEGVDSSNGGLFALSDIQPGEYVLSARFGVKPVGTKAIDVPAGQVAVSVTLSDPARVGTFLTPGSHVVLFDSFDPVAGSSSSSSSAAATGTQTRVLLDDVLVIAMGEASLTPAATTTANGEAAPPPVAGALLTVSVSPADALRLVHGIQTGRLYAALRGTDAKIDLGKVVSQASLFTTK